ncbi:MAG TPA: TPM domain-containing protein, partial [Phycisphaerae bacterium]|nr:TPM domain-containing protein [Phycisphaerae bacterium]
MRMRISLILLLGLVSLPISPAGAVEPAPTTYVTDRAGVIDPQTAQMLTALLQELEQKTGARIIVLTVDTTDGQDIHDYAFQRADAWKMGPNNASASVLVVAAIKDRNYRFEVGYDWEPVLTDGFVGQVGRTYLVPQFKAGNYSQGIYEATAALAGRAAAEKGVILTGMPTLRPMTRTPSLGRMLVGFIPILFIM